MRILIDNTGFHSAGRCLDKMSLGLVDVKGLLQFAIELIFSEEILISGFESDGVLGRTEAIVEKLRSEGVGQEAVHVWYYSTEEYAKACQEGAVIFASNFEHIFTTQNLDDSVNLLAIRPDLLPKELKVEDYVHTLIKHSRTEQELEEIAKVSLQEKAVGSMAYMLSSYLPLWEKVQIAAASDSWTPKTTMQLIAALRYYMNNSLAKNEKAYYTPAVARAEMLRRSNAMIKEAISSIVVNTAKKLPNFSFSNLAEELNPKPLGLPSLSSVLVQKAKGDPSGIIAEAVRFRAMATDLRKYLTEKLSKFDMISDWSKWCNELSVQLKDLEWALERELPIKEKPKFCDAIDFTFSPPFIAISSKLLNDWRKFIKLRKYIVVLTELSNELRFGQIDPYALDTLTTASIKNSIKS